MSMEKFRSMVRRAYYGKTQEKPLIVPAGEAGIVIRFDKDRPSSVDFRNRPVAQVIADLLVTADSLANETIGLVAGGAGIPKEYSGPIAAEAQVIADLLTAAAKLVMLIEDKVAKKASLSRPSVQEAAD